MPNEQKKCKMRKLILNLFNQLLFKFKNKKVFIIFHSHIKRKPMKMESIESNSQKRKIIKKISCGTTYYIT